MITNKGKVLWASAIGNLNNGYTGTVKSSTPTNLEANGGPKWAAEQFVGQDVYAGGFAGTVVSNTETVLTVAQWENLPQTAHETWGRSEKAAGTPAGSAPFYISAGRVPASWIAVTANSEGPKVTNETLAGEIKTAGGGLLRSLATFKYLGEKEYEVKITLTANGSDVLPVTLAKIGIFNAQAGGVMMFESLLTVSAEIKSSGDSVTITDVITGS